MENTTLTLQEAVSKRKALWIYWALTAPVTLTMFMAGLALVAGVSANIEGITMLGYPLYLCKILGVAKLLGSIGIVQNRFHTLKEWAYAGYSFNLLGASVSYIFTGDSVGKIITPVVLLAILLGSYWQWKRISSK